jgi:type II secretory pathway component PulC
MVKIDFGLLEKRFNVIFVLVICMFVFKTVRAYFFVRLLKQPIKKEINIGVRNDFFKNKREYEDKSYFEEFVKPELLILPTFKEKILQDEGFDSVVGGDRHKFVLELQGVIWSEDSKKSVAIFNYVGRKKEVFYLRKGEILAGWMLREIAQQNVVLAAQGNGSKVKILKINR